MSDLARVSGARPTIELDGVEYEVCGEIGVFGQIESRIIQKRGNPFDMLVEAARSLKDDPQALNALVNATVDKLKTWRFVDSFDYMQYTYTPDGLAYLCYQCIKHNDKNLTFETVREKVIRQIRAEDAAHYQLRVEQKQAAGIDPEDAAANREFDREFSKLYPVWRDRLEKAISQASGVDDLGNSIGLRLRQANPTGDSSTAT